MRQPRRSSGSPSRPGAISVLFAVLLVAVICIVAFAVDLGYLVVASTELKRTADSAALAACWELIDDEAVEGDPCLCDEIDLARVKANEFTEANPVTMLAAAVDLNEGNSPEGDVVVGHLDDPSDPNEEMTFEDSDNYNAVRVKVRKADDQNGEVPMFFARLFGLEGMPMEAEATAALLNNIDGFGPPPDDKTIGILPYALDVETWDDMLDGGGSDSWTWDEETGRASGADGVREVNLFPQGTGSPGNRGTIDIGGTNNSTSDIARQIVEGISVEDMETHIADRGPLEFNGDGELFLNGDTGISAGVKDELASIIGEPRVIPLFSEVEGNGNNAEYTIVRWVGVRILEVKLTGKMSGKKVIIQPATVVAWGGKSSDDPDKSTYVYSPVWLVR